MQNFATNLNCLNFRPEMPYLGIFGIKFQKTIIIFETSNRKFVILEKLPKKQNWRKLAPKMDYIGIFELEF